MFLLMPPLFSPRLLAKVGKGMEVNPGEEFRVALQVGAA